MELPKASASATTVKHNSNVSSESVNKLEGRLTTRQPARFNVFSPEPSYSSISGRANDPSLVRAERGNRTGYGSVLELNPDAAVGLLG